MCQIDYRPKAFQAVAVALANNEIHLYKDKFLVDVIQVEENIYSMKFGRLGREDATLVMITKSNLISIFNKQTKKSRFVFLIIAGGLIIKILKRTATFEENDTLHGPPKEQQVKIDVPKRTKLYVDQTLREKEQAESKNFIISNSEYLILFERYVSNISTRFNSFKIINWKRISQIY
jgi:Bardet-Biedl syndrome 1 protein